MNDTERLELMMRRGWSILEGDKWFVVLSLSGRPIARGASGRDAIDAAVVKEERFREEAA